MNDRIKVCLAVFAVALVIRVITVAVLLPNLKPDANWDYYRDLGRNLAVGNGFVAAAPGGRLLPNVMRTPIYPLLLAVLVKLGGDSLGLLLAANCLLGAMTCVLTVVLASRWLSLRAAAAAGLIAAVDPNSVVRCATVMSDTLFVLLLTAGVCVLAWRTQNRWAWFVTGLLWALAVLCRPIGIWLWGVAAIVALVERKRLMHFALFLAAFLPLIGLWMARNAAVTGHWFFSTAPTYNLVDCWSSSVEARRTGTDPEAVQQRYLAELGDLEFYDGAQLFDHRMEAYRHIAREVLRPAPLSVAREAVVGWAKLLLGPGQRTLDLWLRNPQRGGRWWAIPYGLALAAQVVLGIWGAMRLGRAVVLPAALVAYFVATGGFPTTSSRFRYPIVPELAILAVAGVVGTARPPSAEATERRS